MILSKHQALLEGSKLWIIPNDSCSPVKNRINWLTNFQLSKAESHTDPQISDWLQNCILECDLENFKLVKYSPILIPVKNLLPTEWLCLLPFDTKMQTWVSSIYKIWNQMHRPKLRVFLPTGAGKEDWLNFWAQLEPNEELHVVIQ